MDEGVSINELVTGMQDRVAAVVRAQHTGLYLSGRAAACRGYLNHRLTFEMLFACNDQPDFGIWAEQVADKLLDQPEWLSVILVKESRRVVIGLEQGDVTMSVVLLNDGPQHLGEVREHEVWGRLDSPENVAAQSALALLTNPEPGDMADLLGLCLRFNLSLERLLTQRESKAAGGFAPDLARVLLTANRMDWELVRWTKRPPEAVYLGQLRRLGERLLPAALLKPDPMEKTAVLPIQEEPTTADLDVKPAVSVGASAESADEAALDVPRPPVDEPIQAAEPAPAAIEHAPEPESEPEPQPADPPVIKRGTGILNFYRAMKAAGIEGFKDARLPEDESSPEEEPAESDSRPTRPRSPFLPPLENKPEQPDVNPSPWPVYTPQKPKPWSPTEVTGEVSFGLDGSPRPVSSNPTAPTPKTGSGGLKVRNSDKRSEERRRVSYYIPVYDVGNGHLVGYLSDISRHGLALDCQNTLVKASLLHLRIDLTPDLGPKPHLAFTAEVRWCHVDHADPNAYDAGLEIVNITADDARLFAKILEKYSN